MGKVRYQNHSDLEDLNVEIEVQGLASISKKIKESVVGLSLDQVRYLVDAYYQMQDARVAMENQARSLIQGYDSTVDGAKDAHPLAIQWTSKAFRNDEAQIHKMLDVYTDSIPMGRYLKSITGIGPVIAAGLLAYLNIDKVNHANQFISYAGLNDNNNPWLGRDGAAKLVKELKTMFPDENPKNLSDDVFIEICRRTHRSFESVRKFSQVKENKTHVRKGYTTWDSLQSYLAMPPFNQNLKKLCFKIGESFVRVSGKERSLYGRLYRQRKAYETIKNEDLEYADQAADILKKKNISKSKDAYKAYSKGKLPKGHIQARAKRATVKIFLSHVFDAMYYEKYRIDPPTPYVLEYMGHEDIIYPEVDYKEFF